MDAMFRAQTTKGRPRERERDSDPPPPPPRVLGPGQPHTPLPSGSGPRGASPTYPEALATLISLVLRANGRAETRTPAAELRLLLPLPPQPTRTTSTTEAPGTDCMGQYRVGCTCLLRNHLVRQPSSSQSRVGRDKRHSVQVDPGRPIRLILRADRSKDFRQNDGLAPDFITSLGIVGM